MREELYTIKKHTTVLSPDLSDCWFRYQPQDDLTLIEDSPEISFCVGNEAVKRHNAALQMVCVVEQNRCDRCKNVRIEVRTR